MVEATQGVAPYGKSGWVEATQGVALREIGWVEATQGVALRCGFTALCLRTWVE